MIHLERRAAKAKDLVLEKCDLNKVFLAASAGLCAIAMVLDAAAGRAFSLDRMLSRAPGFTLMAGLFVVVLHPPQGAMA